MSPLTQKQRDWLLAAPESFDRIPIELGVGTLSTLVERGLVEVAVVGQDWRRTEKGRVVAAAILMDITNRDPGDEHHVRQAVAS